MLITLARKPLPKGGATVVQTCLAHGTGALNIDACRVGTGTGAVTTVMVPDHRSGNFGQDTAAYKDRPKLAVQRVDQGRWPANVILSAEVAKILDQQSGTSTSPNKVSRGSSASKHGSSNRSGVLQVFACHGDVGGASRFFKKVGADPC